MGMGTGMIISIDVVMTDIKYRVSTYVEDRVCVD